MSARVASPLRLCVPQPLDDHPFSIASSPTESDQKKRNSERRRALLDRSDSQEDMKANAKWQILWRNHWRNSYLLPFFSLSPIFLAQTPTIPTTTRYLNEAEAAPLHYNACSSTSQAHPTSAFLHLYTLNRATDSISLKNISKTFNFSSGAHKTSPIICRATILRWKITWVKRGSFTENGIAQKLMKKEWSAWCQNLLATRGRFPGPKAKNLLGSRMCRSRSSLCLRNLRIGFDYRVMIFWFFQAAARLSPKEWTVMWIWSRELCLWNLGK